MVDNIYIEPKKQKRGGVTLFDVALLTGRAFYFSDFFLFSEDSQRDKSLLCGEAPCRTVCIT